MIVKPYQDARNLRVDKKIMAKLLRKDGYSLRQIGKFLGYGSPRSVQLLIAPIK